MPAATYKCQHPDCTFDGSIHPVAPLCPGCGKPLRWELCPGDYHSNGRDGGDVVLLMQPYHHDLKPIKPGDQVSMRLVKRGTLRLLRVVTQERAITEDGVSFTCELLV